MNTHAGVFFLSGANLLSLLVLDQLDPSERSRAKRLDLHQVREEHRRSLGLGGARDRYADLRDIGGSCVTEATTNTI